MLILDRDNWILYELVQVNWTGENWEANCGAVFDLATNKRRPEGWTSTDAAGLAVLPGLVRYDEVYGTRPTVKGEKSMNSYKSPLHKMEMTTPTDFWNDSCSVQELTDAIDNGAVGATTNPTIVHYVLKKEMHLWKEHIYGIIRDNPTWSEVEITWKVNEDLAANGARLLFPVFEREQHKKRRISIQTNPQFYRNAEAILKQALHFNSLARNMQVKIPVTKAGIVAIEEATYRGVNINATVSFTVPQAIAVAEAVERGLRRREAEGLSTAEMSPVSTCMIGRLDDWLHVLAKRDSIAIDPGYLNWAGIACLKRIYHIFRERGYCTRPLGAAIRHHKQTGSRRKSPSW